MHAYKFRPACPKWRKANPKRPELYRQCNCSVRPILSVKLFVQQSCCNNPSKQLNQTKCQLQKEKKKKKQKAFPKTGNYPKFLIKPTANQNPLNFGHTHTLTRIHKLTLYTVHLALSQHSPNGLQTFRQTLSAGSQLKFAAGSHVVCVTLASRKTFWWPGSVAFSGAEFIKNSRTFNLAPGRSIATFGAWPGAFCHAKWKKKDVCLFVFFF